MDMLFWLVAIVGILWCVTGIKREGENISTALQGEPVSSERQTGCGEFVALAALFGLFLVLFALTGGG